MCFLSDFNDGIIDGARTAFIDENFESSADLKPQLIFNNLGNKVLNSIKDELTQCDEFFISVAFITKGGLTPLLQDLLELEARGIKGKIITTDYLNFTEPEAIKKLNSFSNIEVKMYLQEKEGFHTKGYIFRKNNIYKAIVGSSNLTLNALTVNKEWNIGFSSLHEGEMLNDLLDEFNDLWDNSSPLEDVIAEYESIYNHAQQFKDFRREYLELKETTGEELVPNSMQEDFLKNMRSLLKQDEHRALLVSATGTGKTYASAFAVHEFQPERFLFLVHREQIAKQAIKAYKRIFKGEENKFGLLSGNSKDYNAKYLFSTVQTMSKEDVYSRFDKDAFDYIVIDEVHKAGAPTYLKLINYFNPKFYLGMSGSPDRTDDFNIYELFDYNVPLDIRLQDALKEDLLCPFHYFGITDLSVDGEALDDHADFNSLVSNDRVNYLLEKSEYYGYSGDRLKALVFCSRTEEAKKLAEEFNRRGHPSIALTGDDSQEEREEAIDRLTNDERNDNLEYIITVDIFNEGVDIPEVNQVLLVRPTQSSIIFIQQLGRGLRKFENKEYVVILDFIGNYENNFLIPIALSGDRTYEKDNIRRYLMEGSKVIPGQSSINFDEISKKRIYQAINKTNFSKVSLFKKSYQNLKFRLGRIPYLCDFYENGEFNPEIILNHVKYDSYYSFLKEIDDDYDGHIDNKDNLSLKFISSKILKGVRPHEAIILKYLRHNKYFTIEKIEEYLYDEYGLENQLESIIGAINLLSLNFYKKESSNKSGQTQLVPASQEAKFEDYQANTVSSAIGKVDGFDYENIFFNFDIGLDSLKDNKDHRFIISDYFQNALNQPTYLKHFEDAIGYTLLKYEDVYGVSDKARYEIRNQNYTVDLDSSSEDKFKLYAKYSREDVLKILNWTFFMNGQNIGGYKIKYNTCPIFVTYDKKEDISETINYEDAFVSRDVFSWMSRNNRRIDSRELKPLVNYDNDLDIRLFVKKSDDEGIDFYYIGKLSRIKHEQLYRNIDGKDNPIVNFKFKINPAVDENIYNYFMDSFDEEE